MVIWWLSALGSQLTATGTPSSQLPALSSWPGIAEGPWRESEGQGAARTKQEWPHAEPLTLGQNNGRTRRKRTINCLFMAQLLAIRNTLFLLFLINSKRFGKAYKIDAVHTAMDELPVVVAVVVLTFSSEQEIILAFLFFEYPHPNPLYWPLMPGPCRREFKFMTVLKLRGQLEASKAVLCAFPLPTLWLC